MRIQDPGSEHKTSRDGQSPAAPLTGSNGDELIIYLLAEFRCAAQRAKLAANDLVAIGLALKGGLINPYQAIMHIEETDAFRFLGPLPGDHWAPWAESSRQYHEDRKRSASKTAAPSMAPA
jgi:hypothetical protein